MGRFLCLFLLRNGVRIGGVTGGLAISAAREAGNWCSKVYPAAMVRVREVSDIQRLWTLFFLYLCFDGSLHCIWDNSSYKHATFLPAPNDSNQIAAPAFHLWLVTIRCLWFFSTSSSYKK